MVESKSAAAGSLWDRHFSPSTPGLPVEVLSVAELRRRVGDERSQLPGRVFFHVVVLCTAGDGRHEVDFTSVVQPPHHVLHVRPGQVHRWDFTDPYDATILLFPDNPGLQPSGWPVGPRLIHLDDEELAHAKALLRLMRTEIELRRAPARRDRAVRGALELLIVALRLDGDGPEGEAGLPRPYVELLTQIQADLGWSRSVTERAGRLGYSPRTLTRACFEATGRTAKEVIDDRIVLEAQRLLVEGDLSVSVVATQLGFSEHGNFTKFFQRLTGERPNAWRQRKGVPMSP